MARMNGDPINKKRGILGDTIVGGLRLESSAWKIVTHNVTQFGNGLNLLSPDSDSILILTDISDFASSRNAHTANTFIPAPG